MQNVARGVGLGGLATLLLACAMAAPAVAEVKIIVPAIHVETHVSPTIVRPPTPGIKTVVPQNSKSDLGRPSSVKADVLNSKSNPGGNNLTSITNIPKVTDPSSPSIYGRPIHSDPALRFTLASGAGVHRIQLDDDPPTAPPNPEPPDGYTTGQIIHIGVSQIVAGASNIGVAVGTGVKGFLCGGGKWC
jgi:hypothetical protein